LPCFACPKSPGEYKLFHVYGAEPVNFRVIAGEPALISISGNGTGQGAIVHAGSGQLASATDPAIPGEVLEIYGTSLVPGEFPHVRLSEPDRRDPVFRKIGIPRFASG
jgi:uncharacterized protein (TIGR03437 family)